jgi:anti-sigma regulatory factor (Ser/Thr protein kinase)
MGDPKSPEYDEEIQLPCEPRAVRVARRFVDAALGRRGWGALDRELATLVTSELVANAVLHAPGRLAVRCVVGESLRVEVTDGRPAPPVGPRFRRRPTEVGGLGLQLVGQVARDWGVVRHGAGKTVWCQVDPRRVPGAERLMSLVD